MAAWLGARLACDEVVEAQLLYGDKLDAVEERPAVGLRNGVREETLGLFQPEDEFPARFAHLPHRRLHRSASSREGLEGCGEVLDVLVGAVGLAPQALRYGRGLREHGDAPIDVRR